MLVFSLNMTIPFKKNLKSKSNSYIQTLYDIYLTESRCHEQKVNSMVSMNRNMPQMCTHMEFNV